MSKSDLFPLFRRMPLASLQEPPFNRAIDDTKLIELTASAKARGILENLLVRPLGNVDLSQVDLAAEFASGTSKRRFEIVAGSRRFRAAKAAGLETVPVSIHLLDDLGALELLLIENNLREDPHEMEQAQGYARLLAMADYTVSRICEKINRDESYVYRRLQLLKLIPELQSDFLAGKINYAHAIVLARVSEDAQRTIWKNDLYLRGQGLRTAQGWMEGEKSALSPKNLESHIKHNVILSLSAAPWKKDDAELLPPAGPCTTCPKRTGSNLLLFDTVPKSDSCLDPTCFHMKLSAFVEIAEQTAKDAGKELVRVADRYTSDEILKSRGAIAQQEYSEVSKKDKKCGNETEAIIVAGTNVGKRLQICRAPTCKVHRYQHSSARQSSGATQTFDERWADRRKGLKAKIERAIRRAALTQLMASSVAPALDESIQLFVDRMARNLMSNEIPELLCIESKNGVPDAIKKRAAALKGGDLIRFALAVSSVEAAREYAGEDDLARLKSAVKLVEVNWQKNERTIAAGMTKSFEEKFAKAKANNKPAKAKGKRNAGKKA